jgi:hypothetical protein
MTSQYPTADDPAATDDSVRPGADPQAAFTPRDSYSQPQAAPPGYYYAQPPVQKQSTNGFAIASMVLGIIWIYWIGSILALVFGYIAKRQIQQSNEREGGGGMATAGIVLGWIGVGTLALVIVIIVIGALAGHSTNGGGGG